MKIDFLADTNFLTFLLEGNSIVEPFIEYSFGVSFVSEIELLGHKGLKKTEENRLKALLSECFLIKWSQRIKEENIWLKRKYSFKLPDAIIASTCLNYNLPLATADKGSKRSKNWTCF